MKRPTLWLGTALFGLLVFGACGVRPAHSTGARTRRAATTERATGSSAVAATSPPSGSQRLLLSLDAMPGGWYVYPGKISETPCGTSLRRALVSGATSWADVAYVRGSDPLYVEVVGVGAPNPQQAIAKAAAVLRGCETYSFQWGGYTYDVTIHARGWPADGLVDEHAYDETLSSGSQTFKRVLVIGRTSRATVFLEYQDTGLVDSGPVRRIFGKAVAKAS